MTTRKDEIEVFDAIHVIANMREIDRKEIFATRSYGDGPHEILQGVQLFAGKGHGFTWLTADGEPAALSGYFQQWPGVASVWAFGTDRWPEVVLSITKYTKRVAIPRLASEGIHRVECAALLDRLDTSRWLPFCGLHLEAVLADFGRQREDFGLYVWRSNDVLQQRREASSPTADGSRASGCGGSPSARSSAGAAY